LRARKSIFDRKGESRMRSLVILLALVFTESAMAAD
jgi:hypothetical protein